MRLAKRRKVRPDDPVAVVTRFLDAANHHDADGLRACVHPDFESFQPLHPARNFRGAGQLISNWKAIFEAEPGFRLTLLRASTTGNTVWAEVHGAGASAEAAGIFVVGVEDGRMRWIRVYSDLVEPLPEEPVEEEPEASPPVIDWDRDPIRLVPPSPPPPPGAVADGEGEPEEPEEGEEVAVAAVAAADAPGEQPALRLVGDEEPEAGQASDEGPIEVLVGEASTVEAEAEVPAPLPPAPPPAAADAEPVTTFASTDDEDEEDGPSASWWDTVATFGGAADPPPDAEAPRPRRRRFLRRGGEG